MVLVRRFTGSSNPSAPQPPQPPPPPPPQPPQPQQPQQQHRLSIPSVPTFPCASPVIARWTPAGSPRGVLPSAEEGDDCALDRRGPGRVFAPFLKRTEDGQGRGGEGGEEGGRRSTRPSSERTPPQAAGVQHFFLDERQAARASPAAHRGADCTRGAGIHGDVLNAHTEAFL